MTGDGVGRRPVAAALATVCAVTLVAGAAVLPGPTAARWTTDATAPSAPDHRIHIRPDPVPGRTVTVEVRSVLESGADTAPVHGATVAFNGERIGVTDRDGTVRGAVPYDAGLRVHVTLPNGEGRRLRATTGDDGGERRSATWSGDAEWRWRG